MHRNRGRCWDVGYGELSKAEETEGAPAADSIGSQVLGEGSEAPWELQATSGWGPLILQAVGSAAGGVVPRLGAELRGAC